MATEYGVSAEGFRKKRLADIKLEIENTLKSILGNNINLLPASILSNLIGVYSERESSLWELAEQVYNSQYPNTSDGVNLDNTMSLVSVERLTETKSLQKALHLIGSVGSVIPAGTKISVAGNPASVFETLNLVTLAAGTDEVQSLVFASVPLAGSFRLKYRSNETSILVFNCTSTDIQNALNAIAELDGVVVTGDFTVGFTITFSGLSGKINHDLLSVSASTLGVAATITELTAGIPQATVDALATSFGPVIAPAFTLTQIDTPVVGLNSVTNPTDAVVGRNTETDNEFRIRAAISQKSRGASTVEAIRAKLLEVIGVTQAIVFQNETLEVNSDGLPPKSFRAYVQGGSNADIFQAIWLTKPAGIKPDGTIAGVVVDSQGLTQNIAFERPVVKSVYVSVKVYIDVAKFPANGLSLVQEAVSTFVNSLQIGEDLIVYPLLISSLKSIPGINDVEIGVGFNPAPPIGQDSNLNIAINEIAKVMIPSTDVVVTLA